MKKAGNAALIFAALFLWLQPANAQSKPRININEFFNAVDIEAVHLAPDGKSVLVETSRADWNADRFRHDLWIVSTDGGLPRLLTTSGHDSDAQWSPDGSWIAFLSDRKTQPRSVCTTSPEAGPVALDCLPTPPVATPVQPTAEKPKVPEAHPNPEQPKLRDSDDEAPKSATIAVTQLYILSTSGGEAIQVTEGLEPVHCFAWSADSRSLYVARRIPWSQQQISAHKQEWKDVQRYREDERGDEIVREPVAASLERSAAIDLSSSGHADSEIPLATSKEKVHELIASPDGHLLAFATTSVSERVEDPSDYEVFVTPAAGGETRQLTHNQAIETHLRWSPDSKKIYFAVEMGSVEGAYRDAQPRIYALNVQDSAVTRIGEDFAGSLSQPEVSGDDSLLALGRLGIRVGMYAAQASSSTLRSLPGWPGTYHAVSSSPRSKQVAFVFSSAQQPPEVYVADSKERLGEAKQLTHFNQLFTQREIPRLKPYRWKSEDGTEIEGVLLFPPGEFEKKHLKMLTFIHGGPGDADGDNFGADWYDWAVLAASDGWLVFRPNYRGSTGYGDKFQLDISPRIVSLPGKDILAGVDSLVHEGYADPDRLAIGGYSYGGYMTNWLITQTSRFKAAVTGAGAVEHAANWGNDDLTFDDAWFLGGRPWEKKQQYESEAAIWQINKVTTPTHMVVGSADIRVAAMESFLMERALHSLKVPCSLLVLPGEQHGLHNDPWHGYIKVRDELLWLDKYVPSH